MKPLTLWVLALLLGGTAGFAAAQDHATDDTDNATHTATGCLRKGGAPDVFLLTDENGKLWALRGPTVRLKAQVGHVVTVQGTIPKGSAHEEADTSPQNNLVVTQIDMVRSTCKQQ